MRYQYLQMFNNTWMLLNCSCQRSFSSGFHTSSVLRKSYYEVLNIPKNAKQSQIKSAYYKLSLSFHPDKNKHKEDALEKFREITEAYETLGDINRRRMYDKNGPGISNKNFKFNPKEDSKVYGQAKQKANWRNISSDDSGNNIKRQTKAEVYDGLTKKTTTSAFRESQTQYVSVIDRKQKPVERDSYEGYRYSNSHDSKSNLSFVGFVSVCFLFLMSGAYFNLGSQKSINKKKS